MLLKRIVAHTFGSYGAPVLQVSSVIYKHAAPQELNRSVDTGLRRASAASNQQQRNQHKRHRERIAGAEFIL
jgi:hypothetical protein